MSEKPRICEILGVEVGQLFTCGNSDKPCYVNNYGIVVDYRTRDLVPSAVVCDIINHPSFISREGVVLPYDIL